MPLVNPEMVTFVEPVTETVGEGVVPIWTVVVAVQPAKSVPFIVYKVPVHKPLIVFPTTAGITVGLIV